MNLHERYLAGETVQVYADIAAMGDEAFAKEKLWEIEKVLAETMRRVNFNLQVICTELKAIGYKFLEEPLEAPVENMEPLMGEFYELLGPERFVPLSLVYFYGFVGAVNFGWDYNEVEQPMWEMADPMQVAGLELAVEMVDALEGEDDDYLQLSADAYHKDNVSGGPAYGIPFLTMPAIDGAFLYEPHETSFINYLRISFEHAGFPGMDLENMEESFSQFYHKVKPQLKAI